MDLDQILQNARHNAAADIFAAMSSEEKSQQLLAQVRGQSDAMIDFGARYKGVPTDQLEIYRAMVRGQGNPFNDELRFCTKSRLPPSCEVRTVLKRHPKHQESGVF